eukprot:CAMPEP_0178900612 /NCGR_PEP_ID=MMETSP0786-20121207/3565_1 /TAXON_ID=186022 /ORGANISM="Thalassionema frauenfeldii, Strain CCMP 1798" /LENGTH=396 /DNA_ID=CAMNT_0020571625 /DNA_START=98 /DNA_END=1288 /DNA_ORIENTATION=+
MRDKDQKISNKEDGVKIINPYLKKKKKKAQISQTAINSFLFSTKTDTKDHERKEADAQNANSVLPLANDVQLTDKKPLKTPNSLISDVTAKPILTLQKPDIGQEISIEQRLPSSNVSFACAEHLSVTELREFLSYYTDRSVRITGIILHRHLVETDASICLVVGDPLARNQNTRSFLDSSDICTPIALNRRTTSTNAKTAKNSVSFKNKIALGSAQVSSFGKNTTKRTPLSSRRGVSGVKRRFVHKPKTPSSCTLLGKNSNKRRLPFSSRTESAINCLVNRDDSILAILNPLQHPEVADCDVGDLIMLIGEIHFMSCNEEPTTAAPFLSHYRSKAEKKEARFLVPRILRNVNGTNVRLQHEAIKRRREHILLMPNSHPIQAGRGPPRLKQAPLAPT